MSKFFDRGFGQVLMFAVLVGRSAFADSATPMAYICDQPAGGFIPPEAGFQLPATEISRQHARLGLAPSELVASLMTGSHSLSYGHGRRIFSRTSLQQLSAGADESARFESVTPGELSISVGKSQLPCVWGQCFSATIAGSKVVLEAGSATARMLCLPTPTLTEADFDYAPK